MAYSQGSRSQIGYIAEVTPGTTPASPVFKLVNFSSFDLGATVEMVDNPVMRADRNAALPNPGNKGATGQIGGPLHAGGYDDFLAALLGGTWATNVLKNGVLKPTFSVERQHLDTTMFGLGKGMAINGGTINFAAGANVECTFDLLGRSFAYSGTTFTGATTSAAVSANNLMRSANGTVTEGCTAVGYMTACSLTIDNGGENLYAYGSDSAADVSQGNFALSGSLSVYWQDKTLLDKFIGGTSTSLSILASDGTKSYTFLMPAIRYTGGTAAVNAQGALTLDLPFTAGYDTTEACTLKITRVP